MDRINPQLADIEKPRYCCVVIEDRCILRCKMCRMWENKSANNETGRPTIAEWGNFIAELKKLVGGPFEIKIAGGEPFFKKDIFDFIDLCHKSGFTTSLNSNGYLIDGNLSRKIGESNLNRIGLSLESLNDMTHDYLRGTDGACQKVKQAIKHLEKNSATLIIDICTIIMEQNLDDILDLVNWVEGQQRLLAITFQALMPPLAAAAEKDWHKNSPLWPKDIKKVKFVIDKLISLKEQRSKISNKVAQLEMFKQYYENPESYARRSDCYLDQYALNVSSQGKIYLCFSKGHIGTVRDNLNDLYYSEEAAALRKQIKSCKENCHFLINCCYDQQ